MRAHFFRALLDNQGNRIPQATVRVLQPGTTVQLADTLFADATSGTTLSNPFQTAGQDVSFYLTNQQRVKLGVTVSGLPEVFWDDVDVLASGTESPHLGSNANSTQVGVGATAAAAGTTAAGPQASAAVQDATAAGHFAQALDQGATAVGASSLASFPQSTAVGNAAVASASSATAVGTNAVAGFASSTAVGAGATATLDHQVMLGTAAESVEVPGMLVLHDETGARWAVKVSADGYLMVGALLPDTGTI